MLSWKVYALSLTAALVACSQMAAQSSVAASSAERYRAFGSHTLDDFLNHEAATSDAVGIHHYSEDLVELVVPKQAGKAYIDLLSDRLAKAEQMARQGKGHLVPEADVVRAYNGLMKQIDAPRSFFADEVAVSTFRAHSVAVPVLPALLSADRNGTDCNPGEAVYLFFLLLFSNGKISASYLDSVKVMRSGDLQAGVVFASGVTGSMHDKAEGRLTLYSSRHRLSATTRLFDSVSSTLGF
jgi:hypothetical protein